MSENNTTVSFGNMTDVAVDSTDIGIVYLVMSVLVMFSNAIVIIVIAKSDELHLPTLWNTAFMAFCDFYFGLHYLVFAVPSAFLNRFAYPEGMIGVGSGLLTLLFGQNILNIVVATVDRYLSVCWPLRYPQLMTAKRFIIATAITFTINVTRLCLILVPKADVYYNADLAICAAKFDTFVSTFASTGLPAISVIVIIGFLVKIFTEITSQRRRIHQVTRTRSSHTQFSVTISLSAGLFCLAYLPTTGSIIWSFLSGIENVSMDFVKFGVVCLLSNSLWNVVIYAITYKPFQKAFLRLFCRAYYRKIRQMEVQVISMNEPKTKTAPCTSDSENIEAYE